MEKTGISFAYFLFCVVQATCGAQIVSCNTLSVELPAGDRIENVPRDGIIRWAKTSTSLSDTILVYDPSTKNLQFSPTSFSGSVSRYRFNNETFGLQIQALEDIDADIYTCFKLEGTAYSYVVNLTVNDLPSALTLTCENGTTGEITISQLNPGCGGTYPDLTVNISSLGPCIENAENTGCSASYTTDAGGKYTFTATLGSLAESIDCYGTGVPQVPHSLAVDSVSAMSVTLSWISGRNGGSPQTFSIIYGRERGSSTMRVPNIPDPGVGKRVMYAIKDLEPETVYLFKLTATNIYGPSKYSPPISASTLGTSDNDEKPIKDNNLFMKGTSSHEQNIIKGGSWVIVVGILIPTTLLVSILSAVHIIRRNQSRRKKRENANDGEMETAAYENSGPTLTHETLRQHEQQVKVATCAELKHSGMDASQITSEQ